MQKFITRFLSNESGATAIEYCLIAAAVGVAILAAAQGLGTALIANFGNSSTAVNP